MKILLIHASAGGGHQKAAEAVRDELQATTSHEVVFIDALDYATPWFKGMYKGSYTFLITRWPLVWGIFFRLVDIPWLQPLVRVLRRIQNGLNTQKLHRFLIDNQFDFIISTHFMPNEVVSSLKKRNLIKSTLISCVTDYDVHRIWLGDAVDRYCVACGWTQEKVKKLGVDPAKISVTGIPSHKRFSQTYDLTELKNKLALDQNLFTILIATGSFGIGPIEEMIEALNDFQIIVICGHNQNLYRRLSGGQNKQVKILGLVDNMHELMAVSDVMVTKPGGLSITEALVSRLPLIFFNAIPGQETNNIKVLKEYDIGISDCTIGEIARKLREIRLSAVKLQEMKEKTKALCKPGAVNDIIAYIR
ncbi:MAG: glycosyltransferase [Candidatus Omnitrophota bacterium]